jgi:transposase
MPQNFIACDREQVLLMPPSLRNWLPEDHLAWFVLDAVAALDLSAFYGVYRQDGHGRAAHDPALMVALLLYAYAKGQRSSRVIERECVEDVAYRVIAANQRPDHTTIARFRQRHEAALAGLFGGVLERLEDERFGDARGDELPPHLSSRQGREAWLRDAKRRLDDRRAEEARPISALAA